ncbi:MAG: histidine kinase [Cyclobacteriaceae bacterium]
MLSILNKGIFKNRVIQHISFWMFFVVFFSLLYGSFNDDYWLQFLCQLIVLPSKLIPTYLVLYVLMPRYLLKEKYVQFIVLLLLSFLIGGAIEWTLSFHFERPLLFSGEDWGGFWSPAKFIKNSTYVYPFVLVAFTIKFSKHWYNQQQQRQELMKGKLEAELKFLKTQLHPHFLFNTLNNLYALTLKKSDAAPELVLKLSDLMDYMLYECDTDRVPLEREIQFVHNYFEVEKLRYGQRLKLTLDVQGKSVGKKIAPLIFLPFLENAFKHGISVDLEEAFIDFKLIIGDQHLELFIVNSKGNMPTPSKNNGIGLKNVIRRLELQYGSENYLLTTEGENSYFKLYLKLKNVQ